jgi:hypothetical protein
MASTFACTTTTSTKATSFASMKSRNALDLWSLKKTLLRGSTASWAVRWGLFAPCAAHMWRVGHEVIQEIMLLHKGHGVTRLRRTMEFSLSLKLEIREAIDEANALKIVRKRLSETSVRSR